MALRVPVARPERTPAGKSVLHSWAPHARLRREQLLLEATRDGSVPSLLAPPAARTSDGEAQEVPGSGSTLAAVLASEPLVDVLSVDSDEDSSGGVGALGKPGALLRCAVCGKGYKHHNCLAKHEWEHHELWGVTKTMCLSKHQQVQLLEAAKVLLGLRWA